MGTIAQPGTERPKSAVEPSRPSSHTSISKQGLLGHVANPINQSPRVQALRATAGMINESLQGRLEGSSAPAQLAEAPALAADLSEPSDGVDPAVSTRRVPEFAFRPGYLAQLADSINSGPRMQALRATAQMIGQHPPMAQTRQSEDDEEGPAQCKPLGTIEQSGSHQGGVVQAMSEVQYFAPQNFAYHTPPAAGGVLNANTQVATGMTADLDLTDPIRGSGVGAGIAANAMTDLGLNFPGPGWVQGHLLNSNLGGLGIASNLFPITNTANMQHTWAVEHNVKELLYGQPPGGNFALANHGYLQYQVTVATPGGAAPTSQAPNATYTCNYRTQVNQAVPAAAPVWNPWQQVTVESQAAGPAPVPAAWTPFGVGIGVPIGGGGAVNVAAYPVAILNNPLNVHHAAMLVALGLGAPPPVPGGATHFLAQQPAAGPALKIIGWQF